MIIFLRSLIFNILFYIWTLLIAFFSFPVFFFNRKYNVKVWFLWIKVTNKILKIVTKLDYETKGLKKNSSNNIIYACQHQSAWDTINLPYLIGDCIIFHKRSLLFIPFFGWHLFKLGMVIITRNKGANSLIKIISKTKNTTWIELQLTEGKNREIRKIIQYYNLKISRLIRISYGQFYLNDLKKNEVIEVNKSKMNNLISILEKDKLC